MLKQRKKSKNKTRGKKQKKNPREKHKKKQRKNSEKNIKKIQEKMVEIKFKKTTSYGKETRIKIVGRKSTKKGQEKIQK